MEQNDFFVSLSRAKIRSVKNISLDELSFIEYMQSFIVDTSRMQYGVHAHFSHIFVIK